MVIEMVIPEEAIDGISKRKWFKFGAYEAKRLLIEKIRS
jgi:hypothetical protein